MSYGMYKQRTEAGRRASWQAETDGQTDSQTIISETPVTYEAKANGNKLEMLLQFIFTYIDVLYGVVLIFEIKNS